MPAPANHSSESHSATKMLPKVLLTLSAVHLACAATDLGMLKRIRGCLTHAGPVLCLKERALDVLNETIMSDKPMSLYGFVDVVKDPGYQPADAAEDLPKDNAARNARLNEMLYDKVEEFFASRSLSLNLGNIIEGRGKKDKNKGGMLMMGGLAMAGMMAQMFMGKIAFMAGAALLVAKLALLLSTIIGFKKLSGGSGGGSAASGWMSQ